VSKQAIPSSPPEAQEVQGGNQVRERQGAGQHLDHAHS
jgi:hypothetical protein